MTDTTTPATAEPQTPPEEISSAPSSTPTEPQATEQSSNREAAKYRTQLRETETERDELRASLTQTRTELVRAAVADYKIGSSRFNIDALEDAGLDVDAIFTDGRLDAEALSAQMTALHESKPYMFNEPKLGNIAPREGATVRNASTRSSSGWQAAFKPETA